MQVSQIGISAECRSRESFAPGDQQKMRHFYRNCTTLTSLRARIKATHFFEEASSVLQYHVVLLLASSPNAPAYYPFYSESVRVPSPTRETDHGFALILSEQQTSSTRFTDAAALVILLQCTICSAHQFGRPTGGRARRQSLGHGW